MIRTVLVRLGKIFSINYRIKLITSIVMFAYVYILNAYFSFPDYGRYFQYIIILGLLGIWMLLPKIVDRLFLFISMLLYTFYILGQIVYYRGFSTYFYLEYAISMRNEVTGVLSSVFELIEFSDYFLFILYLLLWLVITFIVRKFNRVPKFSMQINFIASIVFFIIAVISLILFNSRLASTDVDSFIYNESDRYIYDTVPSTDIYVQTFGINSLLLNDLYRTILEPKLYDYDQKTEIISTYLAKQSSDLVKNEYSGIFKDKNLIVIQGESLTALGIDSVLTPTLYNFLRTGIYFENFSAPLLPGSTSDTEIMIQNSLYPSTNGYATMHAYANNIYPITLAKIFKNANYNTDIYHNNYGTYYNRNVFYANDAYDNFYEPVELGLEDMCSDLTMLEYSSWIVAEKERFYSYFITYSGHQPYNFISTKDSTMSVSAYEEYMGYVDLIDQTYPGLDEFTRSYLAKSISLDRGMRKLIVALDTYGKLDDTVIVLFGDHMIKGYGDQDFAYDLGVLGLERNTVPLIIWDSSIEHEVVDKYCNSLDVLPTLLNMFGLEYDDKYVFGYDVFNEDYIGYYFDVNGTIESKDFKYDYSNGLIVKNDFDKDEAMDWIDDFLEIKRISSYIIETDYFNDEE